MVKSASGKFWGWWVIIALALTACATTTRATYRDAATMVNESACAAASVDPVGVVSLTVCGAGVIHEAVWWLIERRESAPTPQKER